VRNPLSGRLPEATELRDRIGRIHRGLRRISGRIQGGIGPIGDRIQADLGRISSRISSRIETELPRISRRVCRAQAELGRIGRPAQGFWGSRQSLIAGLALTGVSTAGAGLWALSTGTPGRALGGTVTAAAAAAPEPIRLVQTAADSFVYPGGSPNLAWPSSGRAAVEIEGMGLMGDHGSLTSRAAIASITKTMTAYVVLKDHPLGAHDSGPTIILSRAMADQYAEAVKNDESSVAVKAGEQITERQALEAMMLASAGDMADILAMWNKGSVNAFAAEMNTQARALGMTDTDYTDPTGLAASTVSTMADQLKLAEAVQTVPALTSIVAERSAQVPVAGEVDNINVDLGTDSIDGIKTGTTAAAGSCLLFSAHVQVGGRTLTILGIVLGMPGSTGTPWTALDATKRLVESVESALGTATVAAPGTAVATLEQGGRKVAELGVDQTLSVVGWAGLRYRVAVDGDAAAATLSVTRTDGFADPVATRLDRIRPVSAHPEKPSTPATSATPTVD